MRYFVLGLLTAAVTLGQSEAQVLPSPDFELSEALKHKYSRFNAEDLDFIYYFTTYAIPEKVKIRDVEVELRKQAEAALSFVINSCASFKSDGYIKKPRRVPGSKTLWYIDIRDYGWSKEDIDAVFKIQPYFLAPLVDAKENAVIFRADWFIVNAMDATKQEDRGLKDIAYNLLLYGNGKEPRNSADFQKTWMVDIKTIRELKLETGSIVDAGDSGVSQHTRQLRRGQTVTGYYWETRDVKSHDIDFIEEIFANRYDASEYIVSHKNGLQVYMLSAGTNDNFKVVNFADPTIVVDRQDRHDPRVRTAKGCVVCHSMGIIPYTNAVRDLFRFGGDLIVKDKDMARAIKAFYLKNDGSEVEDDNRIFKRAVEQCNGLDPQENAKAYQNVYEWYCWQNVTQEQAALEWGMSKEEFLDAIKATTTGRLTQLYYGKAMPRDIWDSINAGGYIQSGLLIKRVDEKAMQSIKKKPAPSPLPESVVVNVERTAIYDDHNRVVVYLGNGITANVLRSYDDEWYYVRSGRWEGYLRKSHTKPVR